MSEDGVKRTKEEKEDWMVLSDFIDVYGRDSKKKKVVVVLSDLIEVLGRGWKKKREKN